MFKQSIAALLTLAIFTTSAAAGIDANKVAYRGGSVNLPEGAERRFSMSGDAFRIIEGSHQVAIPYESIESIEYGQKAGRRLGAAVALTLLVSPIGLLMLFSKKRKHMVTLVWAGADGKKEGAVFEFGKSAIRSALTVLSARSGKQVEYESEDARKHLGR
jgi:hypothetical protein